VTALPSWEHVNEQGDWESILIGNGASRAIWEKFSYDSLYEAAVDELDQPLSNEDQALFQRMGTTNFERVLSGLLSAEEIGQARDDDTTALREQYERIQGKLGDAVRHVHIPWGSTPDVVLQRVRDALKSHLFVFSTNYDVLLYWAMMLDGPWWSEEKDDNLPDDFVDYFFHKDSETNTVVFDSANTEIYRTKQTSTRVLYLHGGLHLARDGAGETHKLCYDREASATILDRFGKPISDGNGEPQLERAVPLVVTEGTSARKEESIRQSDYLSFARETFAERRGGLVVFGNSLSKESDSHIASAINEGPPWERREIAISIYPSAEPGAIDASIAHYKAMLPKATLRFFNSTTHPLGATDLIQKEMPALSDDSLPF